MTWSAKQIVGSVLGSYRAVDGREYRITRWPDEEKANRNVPEVDAIAEADGAPALAIEVTKIETFTGQHFDDRRTYNPHHLQQYCFLGPAEVLNFVNLPNLRLGPKHDAYWEQAMRDGRV